MLVMVRLPTVPKFVPMIAAQNPTIAPINIMRVDVPSFRFSHVQGAHATATLSVHDVTVAKVA
jgi:hypothetical protein